jgi:hypothetical protein
MDGRSLIQAQTLKEIHSPQMIIRASDAPELSGNAAYAMGWFVDQYRGYPRLSHGGYLHHVNSHVTLFPEEDIGIVSFSNFGPTLAARFINEQVFDVIKGAERGQAVQDKLAQYERMIGETRERNAAVARIAGTSPSHALADYAGVYVHAGYGAIEIQEEGGELLLRRQRLRLPLEHWHYDAWVVKDGGPFLIHMPHELDPTNRLAFETDVDGRIGALSLRLESMVAPIRFARRASG